MDTKRISPFLVTAVAAAVMAGSATASSQPSHASLVIRHQMQGCHSWSVDGGAFKVGQSITLRRGGWLSVTDNDMMPHRLVQTGGPAVALPGAMTHLGAVAKVRFAKPGVYRFTTKTGDDYMPMKTAGADNVLRLTVTVR